jgi:hypothetical protein
MTRGSAIGVSNLSAVVLFPRILIGATTFLYGAFMRARPRPATVPIRC